MAFKPKNASGGSRDFEPLNLPTPREGNRKARVSLIVDMGTQDREDFEDEKTGEKRPQKPCQQLAVFADLVADRVDYGGNIGKKQYRLLVNKSFAGQIQGINFAASPPKDAKGKLIEGKKWGWHPASALSKIAKAIGEPELIEIMDVEQLLDKPFLANVEVKKTESKDKKDAECNPIVYTNVNFKGASPVPEDDDGNPTPVADLDVEAKCITFDNATKDDIQLIRAGLRKQIKLANDYAGSQMQTAIEEWEAEQAEKSEGEEEKEEKPKAAAKPADKAKPKAKPKVEEAEDEDVPF